ncbi:16S rRNA (uracil(1498)-N(3))-methyltransferase [hydrothermal vent metagenome]|uniref:16S rRNA (uracil(1498)-N(3))-methyltransferase n=1 Tax=hydrothermal vent metagenome TaxID=652676 RepID=A0A3B1A8R3_9ZZZZ
MRVPRIYLNQQLDSGNTIQLSDEAHRHVINVLRLREKDKLIIFNAQGHEFNAFIEKVEKKQTSISIEQQQENTTTSPLHIELGLSLIKNDKLDFAIQKTVELGVTSITPLSADRSTIKLDSKRELRRRSHWQGIIQSACEQSGRNILPKLNTLQTIPIWLASSEIPGIIFEPRASIGLNKLKPSNKIRIIIGPEGGFSKNELEEIAQYQFTQVKLGPRILRAETAAITAIATLQLLWGDLNN